MTGGPTPVGARRSGRLDALNAPNESNAPNVPNAPNEANDILNPLGTAFNPAAALAEGFARQVQAWSLALHAPAEAAAAACAAARAVSTASSAGHVCWPLAETGLAAPLLLASNVVGTLAAPGSCPLVLDDEGRLYLHRDFDHERALARRLLQAAQPQPTPLPPDLPALMQQLFPAATAGAEGVNWQQLAAALALRQRLLVVSGGPGTGKTTTVVQLLALLLAAEPGCRIALAAPTGKAAARMAQALQARAASLPAALRDSLPTEASTVHRLLGATDEPGRFRHHAGQPLAIDALVVDEASMLDLALARRLLDAVPPQARIVLLGDKDQLAAVESGAVFADLSASPALNEATRLALAALCGVPASAIQPPASAAPAALPDSVVWLTQNHRFAADSTIGRLATAVRLGDARGAQALLQAGGTALALSAPGPATLAQAREAYEPYLDILLQHPADPAQAHAALARFRVLCAVREGPQGVNTLNQQLAQHARDRLAALQPAGADALSPWFAGRPVGVRRNDPTLGLFNGDIGIALPAADGTGLRVWFADARQADGWRAIAPARLPVHETAFAMTVHKSQGSEFDAVLVALPAHASRVLTRELLYTAVTRARHHVALAATTAAVATAVATPTQRHSGLQARLREAAAALATARTPADESAAGSAIAADAADATETAA